jgi:ABC-2 type transport system ATP-binding protein
MRPDAGASYVLGARVPAPATLPSIGAMVEEPAFYPWLSGTANLHVLAETGPPVPAGAVEDALGLAGLTDAAGKKVRGYSQGMRQRLGLAAALMRRPALLILDEPANGLDPAGIREFRDRFRSLGDRGVTVFLSSHLLGEVERICDRVGIVDRGRLVAVGTVDELSRRNDADGVIPVRVTVRPEDHDPALRLLERFAARAEGSGSLVVTAASGREVNEALARGGIFADGIAADGAGLEETFLALTRGSRAPAALDANDATEEGGKRDAHPRG